MSPTACFSSSSRLDCSRASSLLLRMLIASRLFCCWLRSTEQVTVMPVGLCVMRTADATLLTFCPPGPLARGLRAGSARPIAEGAEKREQLLLFLLAQLLVLHLGVVGLVVVPLSGI